MTISTAHSPDSNRHRRPSAERKAGFTLPELLVAMAIAAMLLATATSLIMTMIKGSQSLVNYSEMNMESRHALERLGRHVRSAQDVGLNTTSTLLVMTCIDDWDNPYTITYKYDAGAATLTETIGSTSEIILRDVSSLTFDYYTLRHVKTVKPIEIKHVQLEAELLREVLDQNNRNYIISAQFMMRNRRVSN